MSYMGGTGQSLLMVDSAACCVNILLPLLLLPYFLHACCSLRRANCHHGHYKVAHWPCKQSTPWAEVGGNMFCAASSWVLPDVRQLCTCCRL
jgi:hypothetical protein